MLILTVCLSAAWIRAQPAVEQTAPNATLIVGVTDAKVSPSGKFIILQTDVGFHVIPTERLDDITGDIDDADFPWSEGWAKTFMPSGRILVKTRRGLYTFDPQKTGEDREIYSASADDEEKGTYLNDGELVVVSEKLIISGGGDYDFGGNKGTIIRFDLRRRRYTRGARIDGFKKPQLSPSGKYVLYEHGNDDINTADLYDIGRNVNYPIEKRFNFKRHFPKYKYVDIKPLAWVAANKFVAAIDENQSEEFKASPNPLDLPDTPAWLALFDAANGKIVWKKQLSFNAPPFLEQLNSSKAFFYNEKGRYEISLADGRLTKLPDIEGSLFTFSPDKKKLAFINGSQIFVSSSDGANKKLIFNLPEKRQDGTAFNPNRIHTINWSPDGKRLFVFENNRLLIIKGVLQK